VHLPGTFESVVPVGNSSDEHVQSEKFDPSSMRPLAIFAASLLLILAGCGYHTAGSSTHLPPDIGTIDVPIFQTNVVNYHTEVAFTDAVVRQLTSRTKDRVTESDHPRVADATLRGTILTETVTPLTYNSQTGQSSSYLITITASAVLSDASGKVLYSNDHFRFHSQYQETADLSSFIQEDSPAVQRMARDFAQSLVSDLMESF
jgi:outer membrane lipopolysaccharide assembly protein LptE/RlpB